MSLALARTHAPGQPEYVLAHSLWVKRTPTCMSGRGSGRGEVALPAGGHGLIAAGGKQVWVSSGTKKIRYREILE